MITDEVVQVCYMMHKKCCPGLVKQQKIHINNLQSHQRDRKSKIERAKI